MECSPTPTRRLTITSRGFLKVKSGSGTELALPADRSVVAVELSPPRAGEVHKESVGWCSQYCTARTARTARSRLLELAEKLPLRGRRYCWPMPSAHGQGVHQEAARHDGLPVGARAVRRSRHCTRQECGRLGLPVFVKPARAARRSVLAGCQLGSTARRGRAGPPARPKVIVEAAISGREPECGGNAGRRTGHAGDPGWPGCGTLRTLSTTATRSISTTAELDVPAKVDDQVAEGDSSAAIGRSRIGCRGRPARWTLPHRRRSVINETTRCRDSPRSMYRGLMSGQRCVYPTPLATMIRRHWPARRGPAA